MSVVSDAMYEQFEEICRSNGVEPFDLGGGRWGARFNGVTVVWNWISQKSIAWIDGGIRGQNRRHCKVQDIIRFARTGTLCPEHALARMGINIEMYDPYNKNDQKRLRAMGCRVRFHGREGEKARHARVIVGSSKICR